MNNKFSIIIPAHNEEKYIGKCLGSIKKASQFCQNQVEIIVILNRCHDRTEEIVKKINVKIFKNDRQNLAALRNFGAKQATGDIIITIDADSWMSQNALLDIANRLNTGKYIGG
ncbi:MAG: glycosyl transferase family 2, partial [Parcubacteria group bacterium CG_4_10_14_0_8_um_filter_35_7]